MRIDANIHLHQYEMRSGYITWTLWTFNDPFHAKEGHMRIEANIHLDQYDFIHKEVDTVDSRSNVFQGSDLNLPLEPKNAIAIP